MHDQQVDIEVLSRLDDVTDHPAALIEVRYLTIVDVPAIRASDAQPGTVWKTRLLQGVPA